MKALLVSDDENTLKQLNTFIKGKVDADSLIIGDGNVKGYGSAVVYRIKKDTAYDAISKAVVELSKNYDYLFFGSTETGREVAGYVAGITGQFPMTEILSFESSGGKAHTKRFFFGGKTIIEEESDARIFTVAPGIVDAVKAETPSEEKNIDAGDSRIRVKNVIEKAGTSVRLEDAKIIVSVGRGIGTKENIQKVEPLVKIVNGELAGSRPVCMDYNWLSEDRQVGLSGKKVSPKLYIALGISGQIQHIAGMRGSKAVIAINKDKNAPIFQECDYGIVGDLFAVVPKLVADLSK